MERGGGRGGRRGSASWPVEITMSRSCAPYDADPKTRFFTVDFGGNPIYTTYARSVADVAQWVSDARRLEHEQLRGGLSLGNLDGSIVVGARICRGVMPSWAYIKDSPKGAVGKLDRAVELLSLCVGGTHCLVLVLSGNGGSSSYERRYFPRPLREFLADRHVRLFAVGARSGAKTLGRDWGVHVACPVELGELFVAAFGRDALRRRGGGGEGELMREMSRVALGVIDAGERPAKFEGGCWVSPLHAKEIKYAAVDAFLSYKIAEKSLEARGGGIHGSGVVGALPYSSYH